MKTVMLTLTTRDVAVLSHSLLHAVLEFRKEALRYPDGSTNREECVNTADMIKSLYDNIHDQYQEQKEQGDAE